MWKVNGWQVMANADFAFGELKIRPDIFPIILTSTSVSIMQKWIKSAGLTLPLFCPVLSQDLFFQCHMILYV